MVDRVYHWTHRTNVASIFEGGLDPAYSEGRLKTVWVCGPDRIGWAHQHVATRHGWDPDEMVLFSIDASGLTLKRTCNRDVYTSAEVIGLTSLAGLRHHPLAPFVTLREYRADTPRSGR